MVSLEYILIPGDPSRGRRSRSDKWSGHGRYFVLLLLLLSVSLSLFSLPSLLFSFLLFFWFLFTISFPPLFPWSRRREERFGSDCRASVSLHPGPSSFATWSLNGMEEWIEADLDPSDFSFLDRFLHPLDRLYRVFWSGFLFLLNRFRKKISR